VALAAAVMGAAVGVVGAAQPAQAVANCYAYTFISSGYSLTVADASLASDAQLVQQSLQRGNTAFDWCLTPVGGGLYQIYNQHSWKCVTTDGVAGHWLTQQVCDGRRGGTWYFINGSYNGLPVVLIQNYDYILDVDVFHDSHSAGTLIDAWPPNITDDSSPSTQQQPFNQWMYQVTP
jgi:hypothetical protein